MKLSTSTCLVVHACAYARMLIAKLLTLASRGRLVAE